MPAQQHFIAFFAFLFVERFLWDKKVQGLTSGTEAAALRNRFKMAISTGPVGRKGATMETMNLFNHPDSPSSCCLQKGIVLISGKGHIASEDKGSTSTDGPSAGHAHKEKSKSSEGGEKVTPLDDDPIETIKHGNSSVNTRYSSMLRDMWVLHLQEKSENNQSLLVGSWQPIITYKDDPFPEPRMKAGSAVINNTLYYYGGFDDETGVFFGDLWAWTPNITDLNSSLWTRLDAPDMLGAPAPRRAPAVAATERGTFVIMGGKNSSEVCDRTVWELDPVNENWAQLASLPSPCWWGGEGATVHATGNSSELLVVFGGRHYLAGGASVYTNQLLAYSNKINNWVLLWPGKEEQSTASLQDNNLDLGQQPCARDHTAIQMLQGTVLFYFFLGASFLAWQLLFCSLVSHFQVPGFSEAPARLKRENYYCRSILNCQGTAVQQKKHP